MKSRSELLFELEHMNRQVDANNHMLSYLRRDTLVPPVVIGIPFGAQMTLTLHHDVVQGIEKHLEAETQLLEATIKKHLTQ